MKKVIGIFMVMIMVFVFAGMAFGETYEWLDEVKQFCKENRELRMYVSEDDTYNIINGRAYAIGSIGDKYSDMWDFMDNYIEYLRAYWPDLAEDVSLDYTYTGSTEHTHIVCVWMELNNGKLFSDYCNYEPAVSKMAALIVFDKEN